MKILVVDDEPMISESLCALISTWTDCDNTTSSHDALSIVESDREISVVITDLNMPGMNGYELSKKIKATNPNIKIVMITGNDDVDGLDCEHLISHVFKKPILNYKEFNSILKHLI
jgi:CheY-like chemotaxis protein